MSLVSYASQCSGFEIELAESLSEADLDALRSDCKILGLRGWDQWLFDNDEPISDFVEATPSVRRKKKAWQEPVLRRRLTLAAIYHVRIAGAMLRSADFLAVRVGISYREMAKSAAQECFHLLPAMLKRWPFEDPDPFSSNVPL